MYAKSAIQKIHWNKFGEVYASYNLSISNTSGLKVNLSYLQDYILNEIFMSNKA